MRSIHIGVSHDDNAVVAQLGDIEPALLGLAPADAGAQRGDQGADFGAAQHAVETRPLDVQDLAFQRQNRLIFAIASLFGGPAGAVTLDQEQFGFRRIALLAIRQLARQGGHVQHTLAPCQLARLARRLACRGRVHHLLDDALGLARMGFEPMRHRIRHRRLHHRLHLGTDQLVLGLRGEFRVRHLHRQHRRHAFAHVVADQSEAVLFAHALGVFAHHPRHRLAETGQMRAAVALRDVVGEAQHVLVERVVPGQRELHPDIRHVDARGAFLGGHADRRRKDRGLGAIQPFNKGHQAAFIERLAFHRRRVAFITQHNAQPGIEEREFPQAPFQHRVIELHLGEGAGGRLEGHFRAARRVRRPDHHQRCFGVAVAEADEMLQPVAPDTHIHPFRQRVHHRRTHAVQATGHLVGILVELAARMQPGQHHLGGRNPFLRMNIGRNATPVIAHRHAAIAVQAQRHMAGEPGLRLVHRIVDDLERHVVQARPIVGVADIHARPLAHRIQPTQDGNRGGVVGVRIGTLRDRGIGGQRGVVTHTEWVLQRWRIRE